ncbi:glucosyltransferase GtrII-like protein [Pantoea sp. AG1095]|uniref:glucosyltransferase domain-containing protein n=1 Tax=Pantoea sp. AG1095 TaxID=2184004 RepID=UPI000D9874BD|nr:glucosyltransferase domain-containing protein [Pantoea sp. AG1095]PYG50413.1 glucosyltransferase GtrII-like protein [Pantoea sp. AG1095]
MMISESRIDSYFKKNTNILYGFIGAFISCLIVYGYELSHFTLSIDEDTTHNFIHMIDLGRWSHAWLKEFIFPEPWSPFSSMIVALICISAAAGICCYALGLNKTNSAYFSVLFIALPQFAYQLQFSNQDETFGVAIFLAASSAVLALKDRVIFFIAFILLNVIVLSIYQSLIFFSATLITIKLLIDTCNDNCSLKKWFNLSFKVAICLAISVAIYIILTSKIKSHYGVTSASYFSGLITWGTLGFSGGIKNAFSFIYERSGPYPLYGLATYTFTYLAAVLIICINAWKRNTNLALIVLLVLIILIMPYALNIAIGGGTPGRTLSQLSLVFSALIVIFFSYLKSDVIKSVITLSFLITACTTVSQLFYSDYISDKQNEMIARRIMHDIYNVQPEFGRDKSNIYFIGSLKDLNGWKKFNSDDFGVSFFERGDSGRIVNYINMSGIDKINYPQVNEIKEKYKGYLSSMQSWPNSGSIKLIDDNIIVKLSD